MLEILHQLVSKISPEGAVLLMAALPVSELRGAIPLAILRFGFTWPKAFLISVVGNMLPVIPWLFFLNYVQKYLMHFKPAKVFFDWLFTRTRKKGKLIEKYETLGLMLFVAVPLPMTGAWTGCIAAFLFGIKLRHACLAILLGVLIAGVIVTALTELGLIGAVITGIALLLLAGFTVAEIFRRER